MIDNRVIAVGQITSNNTIVGEISSTEITGKINSRKDILGEIACANVISKLVEPKVVNTTLIFPKVIKLKVEEGKLILWVM